MGILIYGISKAIIGIDEFLLKCPSCETSTWHDVMISSKYMHFFWIPACPVEKEADLICKKCGLKRYERGFDKNLIPEYDLVKNKFRHPFYTYVAMLLIGAGVVAGIILAMI